MPTPIKRTARKAKTTPTQQYDTPWKIALEQHFQAFMAFYFPAAHKRIDWAAGHEFLDKELQAIIKNALVGTRHVDKLIKVRLLSGEEDWIYVHVEVQVSRQSQFAQRMFIYNYRLFDRYTRPIASMAVLGDDDPKWMPQKFAYAALGCKMGFSFPVAKLARYTGREAALARNPNPFALLTLAYLQNRATATDMAARYEVKCKLVRLLHARKWDAPLIRQFFTVIDWMMVLPPELENKLTHYIMALEEEKKMEYVNSVERYIIAQTHKKGVQEGIQEGSHGALSATLCRLLSRRFGELPQATQTLVQNASTAQIDDWIDRVMDAPTLEDVFQDLPH